MKDAIDIIQMEQLSDEQRRLAKVTGLDVYKSLISFFGGELVYIPTAANIIKEQRNKDIIKRYNGANARELADEFNVSIRTIQRIIADRGY